MMAAFEPLLGILLWVVFCGQRTISVHIPQVVRVRLGVWVERTVLALSEKREKSPDVFPIDNHSARMLASGK